MSDWSEGYVTDIGYTYGYYPELNPLRLGLAFAHAGIACPKIRTACELGFGQGVSVNIHAAGSDTEWYGTDFNPSQVAFANSLAASSGSGARLYDDAFADFARRDDLPDFDFIGLHGIWSWIDDNNRAIIVDFLRRKLKVGGVLYISYNTMPGWAATVPMRELLTRHTEVMAASGQGIVSRIDAALEFFGKLLEVNPGFAKANPQIPKRHEKLMTQNRHYLAHEYFNRDWLPMSFGRMAEWLAPAKLTYACSANFLDHVDIANLTAEQQEMLRGIPDPMFREMVRDFIVNTQFRKDYWVRGARKMDVFEHSEVLRSQRVVLSYPRKNISLTLAAQVGEINLQKEVYDPLLDLMSDYQPRTLGQIEQALSGKNITLGHIREAMLILSSNYYVRNVQDDAVVSKVKKQARRLNQTLGEHARANTDFNTLVSPLTGSGLALDTTDMLLLQARNAGLKTAEEWVQQVWRIMVTKNRVMLKDGKPVATEEENLAVLRETAASMIEMRLPIYKAHGIID